MTLTYPGWARGLQFAGLAGSALALLASAFMGPLYDVVFVVASAIAVGLDVSAIRTRWVSVAILAALLKPVVLLLASTVLFMGRAADVAPFVDPEIAPKLLLLSCVPSVAGALGRWLAR